MEFFCNSVAPEDGTSYGQSLKGTHSSRKHSSLSHTLLSHHLLLTLFTAVLVVGEPEVAHTEPCVHSAMQQRGWQAGQASMRGSLGHGMFSRYRFRVSPCDVVDIGVHTYNAPYSRISVCQYLATS